eukprot:1193471-Pyramimonas_sp.AAC.1
MAFIRAVESHSTHAISAAIERYPHLCALVPNPYDPSLATGRRLAPVREHAVELAREHAIAELTRLQEAPSDFPEELKHRARQKNLRLLSKLSPGKGKFVSATRDKHGALHTRPDEMAADFRAHWRQVFAKKSTDQALRRRWFQDDLTPEVLAPLPPADSPQWQIRREDIQKAIRCSG